MYSDTGRRRQNLFFFFFFFLITKRKHMRDWCVEHRVKSVSVPWLGRSLDKLDSQRVQNILSEVFTGVDIVITIYSL